MLIKTRKIMSEGPIIVKVTEDDLFAAASELYNTGHVEWVSIDGRIIRLESPPEEE